jgi:hypothetical protein
MGDTTPVCLCARLWLAVLNCATQSVRFDGMQEREDRNVRRMSMAWHVEKKEGVRFVPWEIPQQLDLRNECRWLVWYVWDRLRCSFVKKEKLDKGTKLAQRSGPPFDFPSVGFAGATGCIPDVVVPTTDFYLLSARWPDTCSRVALAAGLGRRKRGAARSRPVRPATNSIHDAPRTRTLASPEPRHPSASATSHLHSNHLTSL